MYKLRKTVFFKPGNGGYYDIYEARITYEVSEGPNGLMRHSRRPESENIKIIRKISVKEVLGWNMRGIKPKITATDDQ